MIKKKEVAAMFITLCLLLGLFFVSVHMLASEVDSSIKRAGGVRQIIIDAGKEIKSISKEISESTD